MIKQHPNGSLLHIQVKTRAKERSISIIKDSACLVRVKPPPVHGRANHAVVNLVAKQLGVSSDRVKIIAGASSPRKTLFIKGMTPSQVLAALHA